MLIEVLEGSFSASELLVSRILVSLYTVGAESFVTIHVVGGFKGPVDEPTFFKIAVIIVTILAAKQSEYSICMVQYSSIACLPDRDLS